MIRIVIGEHNWDESYETNNTDVFDVASIKIHPFYDSNTESNDIAIVTLKNEVPFKKASIPACLSKLEEPIENESATVVGWGLTSFDGIQSRFLQKVNVTIDDHSLCKEKYGNYNIMVNDKMLCASDSGQDSCQGDSGGPLLKFGNDGKVYVVGIVSFGIGCAHPYFPGVYTNVAKYVHWVHQYCTCDK